MKMMPLLKSFEKPKTFKEQAISLCKWLRKNVFCKDMFFSILIAEIIFWSPCIIFGFLGIFVDKRFWGVFGTVCTFWAMPLTPAMPLQFALAGVIKKLFSIRRREKK